MALLEILLLLALCCFLLWKWSVARYGVWRGRDIPYDKPLPLIGNWDWRIFVGRASFLRWMLNNHKRFKDCEIYGVFSFRQPSIFINDPGLVKKIAIQHFDHFSNRMTRFKDGDADIFGKSLLTLKDRRWKEMRSTLSPAFTGSKLRLMFELMQECGLEGVRHVERELDVLQRTEIELELKEYFTKFASDVIASTAFGIKVNSFQNPTNEFYTIGRTVMTTSGASRIKSLLLVLLPKIMQALGIKAMNQQKVDFFRALVLEALNDRQQRNIVRPDMIQLLLEARRSFKESGAQHDGGHVEFRDDDLVAQCLLFFLAGFETVSTCLCFAAYELLMNADVQQRLYEEIVRKERDLHGKPLSYECLNSMQYMEMVVAESLRKWPPAPAANRVCNADCRLVSDNGSYTFDMKRGDIITFPIIAYHYDERYFTQPEQFDPERFSAQNKHAINSFMYMPFGVGPRACIGNRFALMEVKLMLYHLLLRFKFMAAEKTEANKLDAVRGLQMPPTHWIKLVTRVAR